MMNEHYTECRILPAINETFPQFSTRPPATALQHLAPPPPPPPLPPSQALAPYPPLTQHPQPRQIIAVNNLILSPLDLSLRAGVNIVPITPPSTPSPPRKRPRFMTDEHYLWRPHVMGTTTTHNEGATASNVSTSIDNTTSTNAAATNNDSPSRREHINFSTTTMTYARREVSDTYGVREEGYETSQLTFVESNNATTMGEGIGSEGTMNSFGEIPKSQRSVMMMEEYHRQQQHSHHHQQQPTQPRSMSTIYVDDETIVLTEDEDEEDDEAEDINDVDDDEADGAEVEMEMDEENETLVSSQELNEDIESNEAHQRTSSPPGHSLLNGKRRPVHSTAVGADCEQGQVGDDQEELPGDEEEYVDILSNDDDDINPLSSKAITMLRLQSQTDFEQELAKSEQVLTRNKLAYENEELHNRAVDGLAKLFDRDFPENSSNDMTNKNKTYIDLTNCQKPTENPYMAGQTPAAKQEIMITSHHVPTTSSSATATASASHVRAPYKTHKTERKRMKLRKHMSLDEETISPVSGTIIRKLRDDEELVVRKGDIDPAFNVVEVTEEAKAILASIDNKIGAYLCQLCRTLYDDAFQLAQHRCPRIVHIEYKCSECEKVFNCPANLASHRRWHKPKSELLANSQAKKRQHPERMPTSAIQHSPEKQLQDDGIDGIFPCSQCGKTFRRQAYLKKHQASHQMLENLKSLDIFKNNPANASNTLHSGTGEHRHVNTALHQTPGRMATNPLYPSMVQPRPYHSTRFGTFPFGTPFDHRRFYTLGEFYLSQQLERSSAFQYVQANHLRNLSNVAAGNFANRPVVPAPLIPLPVK